MNDRLVFEGFGLRVIFDNDEYYALYESGESVGSHEKKRKLTISQVERAMISESEAYKVLLEIDE